MTTLQIVIAIVCIWGLAIIVLISLFRRYVRFELRERP